MKSIYDVISLILFAGVALLFLQRSAAAERDPIPLWRYAVSAFGCAGSDLAGNDGLPIAAGLAFAATAAFSLIMLKPFSRSA